MKKLCAMLLSTSILNLSAVVGADGGTIYGNHAAKKDVAPAALKKQLQEQSLALATLQNVWTSSSPSIANPEL